MTGLWFLPTHNRPESCQQALDACVEAEMTQPGLLYIDGNPEAYRHIKLPPNWSTYRRRMRGGLGVAMKFLFKTYPYLHQYSWLADDLRPRTKHFDLILSEIAGRTNFACSNDNWMANDPYNRPRIVAGAEMCGALCWGGDLVRTVGWWAPPFLKHVAIDVAWCDILMRTDRHRFVNDVMVEHFHWQSGAREKDDTDKLCDNGSALYATDVQALEHWRRTEMWGEVKRIRKELASLDGEVIAASTAGVEPIQA